MLNKEMLLLVSKHEYTLVYSLGMIKHTDTGLQYGYEYSNFGEILYNRTAANTSPDKKWRAFYWFVYYQNTDRTSIELHYHGASSPNSSPDVIINGTLYKTDHGSIYLDGDPFDLVGLYKTGSPLYLNITWP